MFAMLLDFMVMVLLLLTIVFCWRLNSKIMELKSGRKDLLELVKTLDGAIIKTNSNITELKSMSQSSAVELADLVERSMANINDLGFINDTAAKLADRLERDISEARAASDRLRSSYRVPIQHAGMEERDDNIMDVVEEDEVLKGPVNFRILRSGFSRAKEELMSALRFVK